MSKTTKPQLIEVTGFDVDHPEFSAEVLVFSNGKARMSNRTGWTHDIDLDKAACEAALQQVNEQRQANRVRMKIRRKVDPETGKEVMDRSSKHAVIKVWPKSDKRNDKLVVNIHFSIGAASGDFLLEKVIREVTPQTMEYGKTLGATVRYVPFRTENDKQVRGDDEWWAARWLAMQAMRTAFKLEAQTKAKLKRAAERARKKTERERMRTVERKRASADKKAKKILRQGGEQLPLL